METRIKNITTLIESIKNIKVILKKYTELKKETNQRILNKKELLTNINWLIILNKQLKSFLSDTNKIF